MRLAGIERTFWKNPSKPAPPLDFTKSSRLKNTEKWITHVDDILRQVSLGAGWPDLAGRPHYANPCLMNAAFSPIVSEFETEEQESSYNHWFRAKVEEALLSKKLRLPHDAAIAKVQAMLDERRKACANSSLV